MSESEEQPKELGVHYVKSPLYRNVAVDGAYGGPTPRLRIHVAFYSERRPIPQQSSLKIVGDKVQEEKTVGKAGLLREVECGIVLDIDVAKELHSWLGIQIETLEQVRDKRSK